MKHLHRLLLSGALLLGCGQPPAPEPEVIVHLYIGAKCERAAELVKTLSPIIERMEGKAEVYFDYIGRDENGAFFSLLGESEVEGDMWELCARESGGAAAGLRFVRCMNDDLRTIPKPWERCAKAAGLSATTLCACVEEGKGRALLSDSFRRAAENNATQSPAVFIGRERYTGLFTEPSLGRALCNALSSGTKPKYCGEILVPKHVAVTVVNDKRCTDRSCDTKRILNFISKTSEGAVIRTVDFAEPEGRMRFEKSGLPYLPQIFFSEDIREDTAGYERLRGYLAPVPGLSELVYPVGGKWDPTREICGDHIDNNHNDKTDCEDEHCAHTLDCRAETPRTLTLFAMSRCAFSLRADAAAAEVLRALGDDISFSIEYVGTTKDDPLTSMHGAPEIEENLRRVCAQKHYAGRRKFMEYILCRDRSFFAKPGDASFGADWTACAVGGIRAAVIEKCANGEEGRRLLADSFERARMLDINGSPRFVANGRYEVVATSAESLKKALCAKNPGLKGCDRSLSSDETFGDYCGGRPKTPKVRRGPSTP